MTEQDDAVALGESAYTDAQTAVTVYLEIVRVSRDASKKLALLAKTYAATVKRLEARLLRFEQAVGDVWEGQLDSPPDLNFSTDDVEIMVETFEEYLKPLAETSKADWERDLLRPLRKLVEEAKTTPLPEEEEEEEELDAGEDE